MRRSTRPFLAAGLLGVLIGAPQIVGLAQSSGSGSVITRFTGTWKEDVSKRTVGALVDLRFQRGANGTLQELRGPDVRPDIQTVVFDGKPHKLENGTSSITWKQPSPNTFERVIADDRAILTVRRIQISADGKTLTEETERKATDGRRDVDTIVFQRISGDQGLVGRWKAQSFKTNNPAVVKYEPAGTNGIKFSNANNLPTDTTYTVAFDGKPVEVIGRTTVDGTMTAAKRLDDRTIEFTNSREGVVSGTSVRQVSADGRTLTVTYTTVGPNANAGPSVSVYVKQ